jgi:cation diffusion facilitator family transporter
MTQSIEKPQQIDRTKSLKQGLWLEAFTIAWNIVEGVIAVSAGLVSNSVALISFGIDSFVETTSAGVLFWRLKSELNGTEPENAERVERKAGKIAGALLFVLAAYIVIDATRRLLGFGESAEGSAVGLILTTVSLVVMPLLAWRKLKTAKALNSKALRADAYETIACVWLSATTFIGLGLNAWLGWSWADPLAALLVVPIVVREGLEGWRGEECDHCVDD